MTDLVVRRLLVDMQAPMARHWCGGDPFRTAFLNALSMSFPVGEQFFIDSVRAGYKALPPDMQERFKTEVQAFAGQEATHRRLHALYNQHLDKHGMENQWAPRLQERLKTLANADVRHAVAITAANEHFTSIFAAWLLQHPEVLGSEDPRLATLWLWHAAEESEHRSTAFDVYRALGGNEAWRLKWFRRVTVFFLADLLRQIARNLRQDQALWRWRTWRSAASFLFGKQGLVRCTYKPWRDYKSLDFHPSQHDAQASIQWLASNQALYTSVGS